MDFSVLTTPTQWCATGNAGLVYLLMFYVFSGLLGLVFGSFLNVVIYRVPLGMSVAYPPSHCPNCNYKLKWYDNIPLVSYIMLGGKCRSCKKPISIRYTLVEFGNMALWLLCTYFFADGTTPVKVAGKVVSYNYALSPSWPLAVLFMVMCSVLICVAFIDLEHTFIPDRFHFILLGVGIAAIVLSLISRSVYDSIVIAHRTGDTALGFGDIMPRFGDKLAPDFSFAHISWLDRVIGAVGSFVLFLGIYFGGKAVYKREAMGFGDVKLVGATGLILGWQKMIIAILLGAVTAAIVLVILRRVRNDEKHHEYPFGPFLVFGMLVATFLGDLIINAYTGLF